MINIQTTLLNPKVGTLTLILLSFVVILESKAQISKVKELAKSAKNSSDSFSSGDVASDIGFYFFAELTDVFAHAIVYSQRNLIERKREEPWLFSADINLHGGYYGKETATILMPSIRANLGIVSSTFRYNKFQDFTGSFPTYDWQVLQFNFVSQPTVNFRMGSGFMHEIENDNSFYEQYFGLELHLNNRKINPTMEVRWAEDWESNRTARFEFNTRVDVFLTRYGKINVNLMAGFLYQKYYEEVSFYFAQTGLTFNIF